VQKPPPQSDFPVGRPRQREFDVLRGNQIIGGQAKCQRPSLDQNWIRVLVNILYRVGSVPDPADRLGILVRRPYGISFAKMFNTARPARCVNQSIRSVTSQNLTFVGTGLCIICATTMHLTAGFHQQNPCSCWLSRSPGLQWQKLCFLPKS
jgi:hypothetical protein